MFYINQGTKGNSGSGYPVCDSPTKLFSARKSNKNVVMGYQKLPIGKIPPFQIHVTQDTFVSALLAETPGGGIFTSFTAIAGVNFTSTAIVKNGVNLVCWSFDGDAYTHPSAVAGRFVVLLTLSSLGESKIYNTE